MSGETVSETVFLDRTAILAADDRPIEIVPVPEWGGHVRVRGISGRHKDSLEQELAKLGKAQGEVTFDNIRARVCTRGIVDADGKPLFQEADADQVGDKLGTALDRVFTVVQRLSKLSTADVEELRKN